MATITDINQYRLAQERQKQAQATATEQESQAKKKEGIGWGAFIIVLLICILLDLIEFFTVSYGIIITIFGDFFLLLYAGMSKSGKGQFKKIAVAVLGEKIPVVAMLPLRSIFWIWAFISSHPEWLEKLGKKLSGVNKILKIASKIPSPVMPELQAASRIIDTASTATNAVNQAVQKTPQHMKANLQAARVAPTRQEHEQLAA